MCYGYCRDFLSRIGVCTWIPPFLEINIAVPAYHF